SGICVLVRCNNLTCLCKFHSPPRIPTLFPYTTLFRSPLCRSSSWEPSSAMPPSLIKRMRSQKRAEASRWLMNTEDLPAVISLYRSEEHTSELQSRFDLVCRLLLEKKKQA